MNGSLPPSQVKIRASSMRTAEQPLPSTACFQTTFLSGPHSVGSLPSLTTPSPLGPRNSGQSSAGAADKRSVVARKAVHVNVMGGSHGEAVGIRNGGNNHGLNWR